MKWPLKTAVMSFLAAAQITSAQKASPPVQPLQGEILSNLSASRLKLGESVVARVAAEWNNADCHLRIGSIVQGHVTQVTRYSKADKTSTLQIAFDKADCNNQRFTDFSFTLIALVGPLQDVEPSGNPDSIQGPRLADLPRSPPETNAPTGQAAGRPAPGSSDLAKSVQALRQFQLPSHVAAGDVINLPKTSLSVAEGAGGGTIISALNTDARLPAHSILVLVPTTALSLKSRNNETLHEPPLIAAGTTPSPLPSLSPPALASSVGVSYLAPSQPPAPPLAPHLPVEPEIADETEVCTDNCNADVSPASKSRPPTASVASIPIEKLGYSPHMKQLGFTFDHETTLTYLDASHLLCTFDPHHLRQRGGEPDAEPVRTIRAVVIDTPTRSVIHVMEWRVRGENRYLWRLGNGLILVNIVHELRLVDNQLKPLRSIPVDGPVTWVVSSPSNDHVVVGILKNRFPREAEAGGRTTQARPEQDLEVRVYDTDFHLISSSIRSSTLASPVLSDQGEVRIQRLSRTRWMISNYGWDQAEQNLAKVTSICNPSVSAPQHNLIFITGCVPSSGKLWYRMLRADGHAVLVKECWSDELAQTAEAALTGSFAVRTVKARKALNSNQPFKRADFHTEQIDIYRSNTGAHLSTVTTDDFILAEDSYTVSPQGDQLALVGKTAIHLFNVKTQ